MAKSIYRQNVIDLYKNSLLAKDSKVSMLKINYNTWCNYKGWADRY